MTKGEWKLLTDAQTHAQAVANLLNEPLFLHELDEALTRARGVVSALEYLDRMAWGVPEPQKG